MENQTKIAGCLSLGGLLLMFVGWTFWNVNEGRARESTDRVKQLSAIHPVLASPERIDPANDGKFVHLTGRLASQKSLSDEDFGVEVRDSLLLRRRVERVLWQEKRTEKKTQKTRGSGNNRRTVTETKVEYSYSQGWSDRPIASATFHNSSGHQNPTDWPVPASEQFSDQARLGAYSVHSSLVSQLKTFEPVGAVGHERVKLGVELKRTPEGVYESLAPKPGSLGSVRVTLLHLPAQEVTVIGWQQPGGELQARGFGAVVPGARTVEQILGKKIEQARYNPWEMRFVSVGIFLVGLLLLVPLALRVLRR